MISWGTILYGAVLSMVVAALFVATVARERRLPVLLVAALSAGVGALLWNAILHRVGGSEFFVDAPVSILPASWQDTGSGVFAATCAALGLGFGPSRADAGSRVALLVLICGLSAFLVDVYLY